VLDVPDRLGAEQEEGTVREDFLAPEKALIAAKKQPSATRATNASASTTSFRRRQSSMAHLPRCFRRVYTAGGRVSRAGRFCVR
jgi:hypothetical protein